MIKNKHITAVCCIVIALAVIFTCLFAAGVFPFTVPERFETEIGYEEFFDTSYVHSINIDVDEDSWQNMLDNATAEEYISCNVTIDGTTLSNVAIRPKGNTSLSNVESLNSERYSFKIQFDEYDDITYKGLDKLCLNNIIQDNTYMKDYFSYRMMNEAGALAPLCSFTYITVNNEDWGLYLAVEAIEEAFARRNFGENYGEIYKPESMAMGGGMGRKNDSDDDDEAPADMGGGDRGGMGGGQGGASDGSGFGGGQRDQADNQTGGQIEQTNMTATDDITIQTLANEGGGAPGGGGMGGGRGGGMPGGGDGMGGDDSRDGQGGAPSESGGGMGEMPEMGEMPDGGDMPEMGEMPNGGDMGDMPDMSNGGETSDGGGNSEGGFGGGRGGMGGNGGGGMSGSNVVALVYQDDDIDSYSAIFDYAVFNPDYADKKRLIRSIKQLNEGENLEEVVNIDEVLRYFVAHNFVVNFDSYTGSMMHNYYLYENDGQMSMIAWDYNLAFGAYSGGGGMGGGSSSDSATEMVNYPIDTPLSGATMDERPMIGKLFEQEEYLEQYHELFDEFITSYFESGEFEEEYNRVYSMILEYVSKDPTKFCTFDEFVTGADTLRQFCLLRAESVRGQLNGTIPATDDGQSADSSALIDASAITISDMGSMNTGGGQGGGMGGGRGGNSFDNTAADEGGMPQGESFGGNGDMSEAPNMDMGAEENSGDAVNGGGNSREGTFDTAQLAQMLGMDETELAAMTQDEIRELLQEKINNGEINLSPRGNRVMESGNDELNIYLLLGASVLVLLLAIVGVMLFKRRRR